MTEYKQLTVRRNYCWPSGGPDLALCDEHGDPLAGQRHITFEPFEDQENIGLLTVTFVVSGKKVHFRDD